MARAGSVAVLLPGAFYFLRETGCRRSLAARRTWVYRWRSSTDCNPGTSPCTSLLLMLNMACTLFRLTPEEALAGVTRTRARALGLPTAACSAPGLRADFVLWDVRSPANSLCDRLNPCRATFVEGQAR
jgi:imidazolonepropionase